MLVPKEQIIAACTLSIEEVRQALIRNGNEVDRREITGVDFCGMNSQGSFVYSITGPDPEGEDDITLGNVYLRFVRKIFSQEFELYGDY